MTQTSSDWWWKRGRSWLRVDAEEAVRRVAAMQIVRLAHLHELPKGDWAVFPYREPRRGG